MGDEGGHIPLYEKFGAPLAIGKPDVGNSPIRFEKGTLLGLDGESFVNISTAFGEIVRGGIYAARSGQVGEPFPVITETWNTQDQPDITRLADGRLFAVWHDLSIGERIKMQFLTAEGLKNGPELALQQGTEPTTTTLKNGNIVVAWNGYDFESDEGGVAAIQAYVLGKDGGGVRLVRVDNPVKPGEIAPKAAMPEVTALEKGGFVVSWNSSRTEPGTGLTKTPPHVRTFDASGKPVSGDVDLGTAASPTAPSVSALKNGNYVVAWTGRVDSHSAVKAQILNSAGKKVGAELTVDAFESGYPTVAGLADGNFVVGWERSTIPLGRIYDGQGNLLRNDFALTTPLPVKGRDSSRTIDLDLAALPDGGFVSTWRNQIIDDDAVRTVSNGAQVFLPESVLLKTEGKTVTKTIAQFEAYRYILASSDPAKVKDGVSLRLSDGGTIDLSDELEGLRGATVYGSDVGNTITTGSGADKLYGAKGEDTLNAGDGADVLDGGAGTDVLQGRAGDDRYYVDSQLDRIDDYDGRDEVLASVSYKLAGGLVIEVLKTTNAKGTGAIDLTGNDSGQLIEGNRGANRLEGRHGDDTILLGSNVFKGLSKGGLADSAFKLVSSATSTKGVDKSDRILYDKAHGDLYFDADGSDGKYGRIKFAEVTDGRTVESNDFLVV